MKYTKNFTKKLKKHQLSFIIIVVILALIIVKLIQPVIISNPETANLTPRETKLAEDLHFNEGVLLLVKKESGKEIEQLKSLGDKGQGAINNFKNDRLVQGIQVQVSHDDTNGLIKKLSSNPIMNGYFVFLSENKFGFRTNNNKLSDTIGIIKSQDKFDILRIKGTSANDAQMDTEIIIKKLKEWDDRYIIEITDADFDRVGFKYTKEPPDFNGFVKEIYAFCPDNTDFAFKKISDLAREIKNSHFVACWWD